MNLTDLETRKQQHEARIVLLENHIKSCDLGAFWEQRAHVKIRFHKLKLREIYKAIREIENQSK